MSEKKSQGDSGENEGLDIWDIALPAAGAAVPFFATRGRAKRLGRKWVDAAEASGKNPNSLKHYRDMEAASKAASSWRGERALYTSLGGIMGVASAQAKRKHEKQGRRK